MMFWKNKLRRLVSDLKRKTVWILLMNILKENLRSFSDFINTSAWLLLMIVLKKESAQFVLRW